MAELAAGSEEAAWRIAEDYTPHILKAVRASLPAAIRPKFDSQDFIQIVWTSLLLKRTYLARLENPQQLIGILAAAARHKVIDAYRRYTTTEARNIRLERSLDSPSGEKREGRNKRAEASDLALRDPTPSQIASLREQWQRLLDQSSARDRKILALRMKGLSYQAIGDQVGVSFNTVRRTLDRLIDQLQK
jgi:RNA polymerase sigma factor (sigma-70 family)